MFKSLLPKEYGFYLNFNDLIDYACKASELFLLAANEQLDLQSASEQIKVLETESDKVAKTAKENLHKTFITPFDRNDIFALIKRTDSITDQINSTAMRMFFYEVGAIRSEVKEFAVILNTCTKILKEAIGGLEKVSKTGSIRILEICEQIHKEEHKADTILKEGISSLFKESDAISIIKWKEIYERLEKATDKCEIVASLIESIIIDNN
jgi:predicted phosphate transport protein (TIGR00153 family)